MPSSPHQACSGVLTLARSRSWSFFPACLIWCFLALTSTLNTRVLLSSVLSWLTRSLGELADGTDQACACWGRLPTVCGLPSEPVSWAFVGWVSVGLLFVAVDAFQHCSLCLQSFGFGFGRGRGFLPHLRCQLSIFIFKISRLESFKGVLSFWGATLPFLPQHN